MSAVPVTSVKPPAPLEVPLIPSTGDPAGQNLNPESKPTYKLKPYTVYSPVNTTSTLFGTGAPDDDDDFELCETNGVEDFQLSPQKPKLIYTGCPVCGGSGSKN